MTLLFWVAAMTCFSFTSAVCHENSCRHGTNFRGMQNTTCDCKKFVKDHGPLDSNGRRQHCIDFRFNIRWIDSSTVNDVGWDHCAPSLNDGGYEWVGSAFKTYAEERRENENLERGGPEVYIILVITFFLVFVLLGAIFQQQKKKNTVINDLQSRNNDLQSRNNDLSAIIEVYTRQYGPIQTDG